MEPCSLPPYFTGEIKAQRVQVNCPGSCRHLIAKWRLTSLLFFLTSSDYCWRIDQPCCLWPGAGSALTKGELGFSDGGSSRKNYLCTLVPLPTWLSCLWLNVGELCGEAHSDVIAAWMLRMLYHYPFLFPSPTVHWGLFSDRHCNIASKDPVLIFWGLSVLPECSIVSYVYYDISHIHIYICMKSYNRKFSHLSS